MSCLCRHHCSSRLTKLRCSLNFKQGRNKYVGKVMDINAISDARCASRTCPHSITVLQAPAFKLRRRLWLTARVYTGDEAPEREQSERTSKQGKSKRGEGVCRWLELILLEAERAWAMAQELKSEMAKAGEEHAGKRRHMLRRFAKARRYATDLQAAADAAADVRTRLEACAYCDYISALELFEKVRQVPIPPCSVLRTTA